MLPNGQGGMAFLEYDYQDQNQNWSETSKAPAADNPDKDLRTDFYMAGLQYMFDRAWGAQIELPYDSRAFETTGGPTGDDLVALRWSQIGDIRLQGIYTGFSPDMSVGVTFGVKLANGDFERNDAYGDIDRDSELGTGSTDLLLGGFYRHQIASAPQWTWFGQIEFDQPVLFRDQYRPGAETDGALGIYYGGWALHGVRITPVAQAIGSDRERDTGEQAAYPVASGYDRALLSPGLEVDVHPVSIYADVEVPVWQRFNGDQLSAPDLVKVIVSYMF